MPINLPEPELIAWLRLSLEPGLTPAQSYLLLQQMGLPHEILAASTSALSRLLPSQMAAQLKAAPSDSVQDTINATLRWLDHPQHAVITMADAPLYPCSLLNLTDPPLLLYVNGRPELLANDAIAVVGARSATVNGSDNARAFSMYLAQRNWCIISGLAEGIDAAAHEGALQAQGTTVAVMATGIDLVYPARNRNLAHRIAEHGALVSEFPLGARALPYHFPKRNRLVAALSKGVLVVEAALKSGSLITARQAGELGREVFAIPGSIHSPLSRGCHALIRQGAKLVESGQDIHDELRQPGLRLENKHSQDTSPLRTPASPGSHKRPPATSAPAQRRSKQRGLEQPAPHLPSDTLPCPHPELLHAMGFDPVDIDALCERTGFSIARLTSELMELELTGWVVREDDGRFQLRNPAQLS